MSRGDAPAFPATNYVIPRDLEARHVSALGKTQGMTLRDYFAAKAMQGYFSLPRDMEKGIDRLAAAQFAYEMADAMLAAGGEK